MSLLQPLPGPALRRAPGPARVQPPRVRQQPRGHTRVSQLRTRGQLLLRGRGLQPLGPLLVRYTEILYDYTSLYH